MSTPTTITGLTDSRWVRNANVACTTFVIYEYFIQLDYEVELFWKKRWTLAKFLYLSCRYYGLVVNIANAIVFLQSNPSHALCSQFFHWQASAVGIQLLLTHIILELRLYAMYGSSRKILTFFIILTTTEILMLGVTSASLVTLDKRILTNEPLPGVFICVCADHPGGKRWAASTFYSTILFMEANLLVLAAWKAWRYRCSTVAHKLMQRLTRDSVIYFFVLFWIYLASLMVWVNNRVTLNQLTVPFTCAFSSVFANRLLLSTRAVHYGRLPEEDDDSFRPPTNFNLELEAALATCNQPTDESPEARIFNERLGL